MGPLAHRQQPEQDFTASVDELGGGAAMEIVVEYFAGCPNAAIMAERARLAMQQLGAADSVVLRLDVVATPDEAARRGFHGSPTILIDGVDPFGDDAVPGTFACRTYETPAGAEGAPSVEDLALAIERGLHAS
jgi:hypothetical protein